MKRRRLWLALGLFLLPLVVRGLWYYRGIYRPGMGVDLPNYSELTAPTPPLRESLAVKPVATEAEMGSAPRRGRVVLIDMAHGNDFELSELDRLTQALSAREVKVEVFEGDFKPDAQPLGERLKYATAFVVIAPNVSFSTSEVQQATRFVARGGRLLVIADPTRNGINAGRFDLAGDVRGMDVASANQLLSPFDIAFSDDYLYNLTKNEGNFRNVLLSTFADDPLAEGLSTIAFYAAHSIYTNTGVSVIRGGEGTFSSITDSAAGYAVAVRSQDGGVLALGDLTFLTSPYNQVADNGALLGNLVDFLLGGERARDLSDYPFIFDQPVAVLTTELFGLSAETIQTLSAAQVAFRSLDLDLTVTETPSSGTDLVMLDLFEPVDETVTEEVEALDIVLPRDSDEATLTVPEFGEVNPAGLGLMALSHSEERTTLILLADSAEDLLALAEKLGFGGLDGCMIRGRYALCKVGEGEGFGSELEGGFGFPLGEGSLSGISLEDLINPPTPGETPMPEPTP